MSIKLNEQYSQMQQASLLTDLLGHEVSLLSQSPCALCGPAHVAHETQHRNKLLGGPKKSNSRPHNKKKKKGKK